MNGFEWADLFRGSQKQRTTKTAIKENVLFQDLNPAELRLVEKLVNVRNYRPGETVFRQGEVGLGMYILYSGTVDIYVEEVADHGDQSKTSHVTQLSPGSFFGEISLVEENGRRTASASAHDECVLIGFFKPDLIELVQRNPSAGVKILLRLGEILGVRLKETTQKITELKKGARK